jgi:hypothetical protein
VHFKVKKIGGRVKLISLCNAINQKRVTRVTPFIGISRHNSQEYFSLFFLFFMISFLPWVV